jgi:molybdate transport system substrate-binding protein
MTQQNIFVEGVQFMKRLLPAGSILFLTACSSDTSSEDPVIHVAAASGLYHAFSEIGEQFEAETGTEVVFSFGSTGQFTQHIREGASYDLFAAAQESYIDQLNEEDLIDESTRRLYAYGRIGFMYEGDIPDGMTPDDLLSDEVEQIAIANPSHAPYGMAARQALETWGIWEEVEDKLVFGDNIRQTVQYVEAGNADTAISALALSYETNLSFDLIDETLHEPLAQSLAVPTASEHPEEAALLIEFIFSEAGRTIMESYGFTPPDED